LSFSVYIRHAAEQDVLAAQDWYEKQQVGLARRFHGAFVNTIEVLETTPFIYQEIYRDIRRAVLHRFPYLVWYRIEGDLVIVLACTHGRTNPEQRAKRLVLV